MKISTICNGLSIACFVWDCKQKKCEKSYGEAVWSLWDFLNNVAKAT